MIVQGETVFILETPDLDPEGLTGQGIRQRICPIAFLYVQRRPLQQRLLCLDDRGLGKDLGGSRLRVGCAGVERGKVVW